MAIYDHMFFANFDEFAKRILSLTSRSFYYGIILSGMVLMPGLWLFLSAKLVKLVINPFAGPLGP